MGRDKASLPIAGEAMLRRVVRLVGRAVERVVVVAAPGQELPDLPGSVLVVRDDVRGEGPLRGLLTGLRAIPEPTELVYVTATDSPWLQPEWIGRLAGLIGEHDCAVPSNEGRLHPLTAIYRREPTLQAAESLLAAGRRRLTALIEALDGRVVEGELMRGVDPGLATLRNVNDPEDYRQALQDLRDVGDTPGRAATEEPPGR